MSEVDQDKTILAQVAESATGQIIDVVDRVTAQAVVVVSKLENEGVAVGQSAINVGDKTFDALMTEVEERRKGLIEAVRELAKLATSPLP